jgi:endonuclease V-like protein UPF0215 family
MKEVIDTSKVVQNTQVPVIVKSKTKKKIAKTKTNQKKK